MEIVKILGVDPSLRNTGFAMVSFDTNKPANDPQAFTVTKCRVISNPAKFTGTSAILNMLEMIDEIKQEYIEADQVIIESPSIMFSKTWAAGTISSIAHVSGGCIAILGIYRAQIFRPNEWNKCRKKEVTHQKTIEILGDSDNWHYAKRIKSEKNMEHILDAASMALWWIKNNYIED